MPFTNWTLFTKMYRNWTNMINMSNSIVSGKITFYERAGLDSILLCMILYKHRVKQRPPPKIGGGGDQSLSFIYNFP